MSILIFKNLLHHTCQTKYKIENGYDGEMKLRCKDCVDTILENNNRKDSNANSCQVDVQSPLTISKNLKKKC